MRLLFGQSKAERISKNVIKRLNDEKLSFTPQNYSLWYAYYSGMHPEVVKSVDQHLKKGGKLSDEFCHGIYERHLSVDTERRAIKKVSDNIQNTLAELATLLISTNIQNTLAELATLLISTNANQTEYSKGLEQKHTEISEVESIEEIRDLITHLMDDTRVMLDENRKLEHQLSKSTLEVEDMRRSMENLKKEVMTDTLTGLPNRKFFENALESGVAQSLDRDRPLSLLVVDIDHFKNFNDTYGHQIGDQVLRLVARTLMEGIKGQDTAARFGGEEFVVLLPETALINAEKVGNTLRERIASKDIINQTKGEKLGQLTISIGVAEYKPGEPLYAFIERADKALYKAKDAGRNKVIAIKYDPNLHSPRVEDEDVIIEAR